MDPEERLLNPYRPPSDTATPADRTEPTEASRAARLGAAVIDSVAVYAILIPLQLGVGTYRGFPKVHPLSFAQALAWGCVALVIFVGLHGYFLAKSAQTIGKRIRSA